MCGFLSYSENIECEILKACIRGEGEKMSVVKRICYWCGKEASTREHVPPKANSATTSEINKNNQKYDEVHTIIKALRSLIPYNRMLISSDGYLIPLNEKYFRVDPRDLGFKYGGEITCVGMLTNIIGVDTDPEDKKNIFATIQFAANEALRMILPTKKSNLCIIHPIAIYYGV